MKSEVLKAIMERYVNLTNLYEAMRECEDTVLVNLASDVDDKYSEDEILNMIQSTY